MFSLKALAAPEPPAELKGVGLVDRVGARLPLDVPFTDETGKRVTLGRYAARGKPILLAFAYYECPGVCTLLLNGLLESLKKFDWTAGEHYDVVIVSIDPREGPGLAKGKKDSYLREYARPGSEGGWHFLTGSEADIRRLTGEAGFYYRWMEGEGQYAHSAALYFVGADGKIARFLQGVKFKPRDLKAALMAADPEVGTMWDKIQYRVLEGRNN